MADMITPPKGQGISTFMMNLASKQFYVTLAIIVFEGAIVWVGTHLDGKLSNDAYVALIGVVHSFLLPIVIFWFKNDQENKRIDAEKGTSSGNS